MAKLIAISALFIVSSAALGQEIGPSMDTQTCAEAQAYGKAHGRVWVHAAGG